MNPAATRCKTNSSLPLGAKITKHFTRNPWTNWMLPCSSNEEARKTFLGAQINGEGIRTTAGRASCFLRSVAACCRRCCMGIVPAHSSLSECQLVLVVQQRGASRSREWQGQRRERPLEQRTGGVSKGWAGHGGRRQRTKDGSPLVFQSFRDTPSLSLHGQIKLREKKQSAISWCDASLLSWD